MNKLFPYIICFLVSLFLLTGCNCSHSPMEYECTCNKNADCKYLKINGYKETDLLAFYYHTDFTMAEMRYSTGARLALNIFIREGKLPYVAI